MFLNYTYPIINSYTDVNGSWGDPTNVTNLHGGSNFTYNETCFNITGGDAVGVTNMIYYVYTQKSTWNYFTSINTSTMKQRADEFNSSTIAYQNRSDRNCVAGCFVYYSKTYTSSGYNDTVIHQGQGFWVLPANTPFQRFGIMNVYFNNTAITGVNPMVTELGTSVKIWTRPL
jgi:hypothetical protein